MDKTPRQRGRPWQRRRARWLEANPLCARCLGENPPRVEAAVQVDHRTPLFKGGADDESNFQSLCLDCHKRKTAEDLAGSGARVAGYDEAGWPIPLPENGKAK